MMIVFLRIAYRESITVLLGTVMLLSCKNDIQQVKQVMEEEVRPEMTGDHLVLIYSDSARIQYKASAPQFLKVTKGSEKYEEYPKGILVISYDKEGKELGSITAKYAKKLEDEMLWEARDEVVIVNAEERKLYILTVIPDCRIKARFWKGMVVLCLIRIWNILCLNGQQVG